MSIEADRQKVLTVAALSLATLDDENLSKIGISRDFSRVIMRTAQADGMGATTGPLRNADRKEQSDDAMGRFVATKKLEARATDDDEKAFWKAEANENAYRSVALANNVLDPEKPETHAIAFAALDHVKSLREMAENNPIKQRTTDGEISSVVRNIVEFQEEARPMQGGVLASVAVRPFDDDKPLTAKQIKKVSAALKAAAEKLNPAVNDEAATAEARADAALDAEVAEYSGDGEAESGQTDADWNDEEVAGGCDDFAPHADEIKATPAEIRAALVEMEGTELSPAEAEAVAAAEEATPPDVFNPQPEHRYLVYSNDVILPPTAADPTGGFGIRAWGTGNTRDEARGVAEIVGKRELSGERLELFLDALGNSRLPSKSAEAEVKTTLMTPALAQYLVDRHVNGGTSIPSWRLTPDGKALGVGDDARQQVGRKLREITPATVENAASAALFKMRPDEPKIGLPLPDAACDVTREHLRAIANATRNFAADAIYKDRDPLGAAIARDGAAPALRAAMYDGKVDAYTKPVAALATVIQEAGQGRLSADQAKAIGRATAAHMLNTLLRGVDECAAFVAPEMGVRAVQPRNLDTRSVVHSLHSSATYTAAPRPPAVSDSQSQGRGGQSQ